MTTRHRGRARRSQQSDDEMAKNRAAAFANWLQTLPNYRRWREHTISRLNELWITASEDQYAGLYRGVGNRLYESPEEARWERARWYFDTSVTLFLADFLDPAWEDWVSAEVASALPSPIRCCLDALGGYSERANSFRRGLTLPSSGFLPIELYAGPTKQIKLDGSVTVHYPPHHPIAKQEVKSQSNWMKDVFPNSDESLPSHAKILESKSRYARMGRPATFYLWYQHGPLESGDMCERHGVAYESDEQRSRPGHMTVHGGWCRATSGWNYSRIVEEWSEHTGQEVTEDTVKQDIRRFAATYGLPRRESRTRKGRGTRDIQ